MLKQKRRWKIVSIVLIFTSFTRTCNTQVFRCYFPALARVFKTKQEDDAWPFFLHPHVTMLLHTTNVIVRILIVAMDNVYESELAKMADSRISFLNIHEYKIIWLKCYQQKH